MINRKPYKMKTEQEINDLTTTKNGKKIWQNNVTNRSLINIHNVHSVTSCRL